MKSPESNDLDEFLAVWNKQKEGTSRPPLHVQKRTTSCSCRHKKWLLMQKVLSLLVFLLLLIIYLFHWNQFMHLGSMTVAYLVTMLLFLFCIVNSALMLWQLPTTNPSNNSVSRYLRNSMWLVLHERSDFFMALSFVVPISMLFFIPTVLWMFWGIDLYTDKLTVYLIITAVVFISDIVLCCLLYQRKIKSIKAALDEMR